jgi:hypothetical protein
MLFITGSITLKRKDIIFIGYVVMPSHIHSIIAFSNRTKSINTSISNGKRFIAYNLVKQLKGMNRSLILNELNNDLNNAEKKEGKIHGVFQTSFDWKECRTEKFIAQKLNYLHWNPCKGNKLVELQEQYIHSSAKFYITGEQGIYPVTSYMELRDVDLTKTL